MPTPSTPNPSPVAGTILNQLGNKRFVTMTGANGFVNLGDGLQFKFAGSTKANACRVTLNASDTYDLVFFKTRGIKFDLVDDRKDVYASQLVEVFELVTGLRTSLGSV